MDIRKFKGFIGESEEIRKLKNLFEDFTDESAEDIKHAVKIQKKIFELQLDRYFEMVKFLSKFSSQDDDTIDCYKGNIYSVMAEAVYNDSQLILSKAFLEIMSKSDIEAVTTDARTANEIKRYLEGLDNVKNRF